MQSIQMMILSSDFFTSRAKRAALVQNYMKGIRMKKVYPYKTDVKKGKIKTLGKNQSFGTLNILCAGDWCMDQKS